MSTDGSDGEAVGYGKPPRRHRFQPGTSGNQRGRPKISNTSISAFRDAEAARLIAVKSQSGKIKEMTKAEVTAHALINAALGGDMSAAAEVLRLEKKLSSAGMLIQEIEVTVTLVGDP